MHPLPPENGANWARIRSELAVLDLFLEYAAYDDNYLKDCAVQLGQSDGAHFWSVEVRRRQPGRSGSM